MTSLTKKERSRLRVLALSVLEKVGDGDGDEWFDRITFQARKPATDEEIGLSAWEPDEVVSGGD